VSHLYFETGGGGTVLYGGEGLHEMRGGGGGGRRGGGKGGGGSERLKGWVEQVCFGVGESQVEGGVCAGITGRAIRGVVMGGGE
jgi:hypothetical protein